MQALPRMRAVRMAASWQAMWTELVMSLDLVTPGNQAPDMHYPCNYG